MWYRSSVLFSTRPEAWAGDGRSHRIIEAREAVEIQRLANVRFDPVGEGEQAVIVAGEIEKRREIDFEEVLRDGPSTLVIEPPPCTVGEDAPSQLAGRQIVHAPKVAEHLSRGRVFLAPATGAAVERAQPALGLDDRETELIALPFLGEAIGTVLSGGARGEQPRLRNQMDRLFSATVSLIYEDDGVKARVSSLVADRAVFWWNPKRPDDPSLWDSNIGLGEDFFNEIIRCPIPIDLNTLRAMRRSPLGLDLYLWLTYRTFALKRQLRLTWRQLYRQFGADPAKATEQGTVDNFRRDCLRELKKIQRSWPDLHYRTVKGALVLSPSPPRIAPSQLRLVE